MYADSPVQVHILIILNHIYAVDIKLPPRRSVSLLLPHLHLPRSPSWVSSVQLSQPRLVCKYCKYVTRCCHQSLLSLPAGDGGAAPHIIYTRKLLLQNLFRPLRQCQNFTSTLLTDKHSVLNKCESAHRCFQPGEGPA